MQSVKDTINSSTVNSKYKKTNTVNSINSYASPFEKELQELLEKHGTTNEGVATHLWENLNDKESKAHYLLLAKNTPTEKLMHALALTKEAERDGRITIKKAVYFQGILKNWGIRTKFRKSR